LPSHSKIQLQFGLIVEVSDICPKTDATSLNSSCVLSHNL
jgi:hypothetical protein